MQPHTMEEAERIARTALMHMAPIPEQSTVAAVAEIHTKESLETFNSTLQQLVDESRTDRRQQTNARGQEIYQPRGKGPRFTPGHGRGPGGRTPPRNQVGSNISGIVWHRCQQVTSLCMTEVETSRFRKTKLPQSATLQSGTTK